MRRYFLNTQYITHPTTYDLISLALVCDDGREFYAINWECDFNKADHTIENMVLANLPFRPLGKPTLPNTADGEFWKTKSWYTREGLKIAIAAFMGFADLRRNLSQASMSQMQPFERQSLMQKIEQGIEYSAYKPGPELWANYSTVHHILFTQLFGYERNQPSGLHKHCNDIQQWAHQLGKLEFPSLNDYSKRGHALHQARYCKELWDFLNEYSKPIAGAEAEE